MGGCAPGVGELKVRVVSVGRDRSGLFAPAVKEYADRLSHYTKLDLVELAAGRSKAEEGKAILAKAGAAMLVALDERGSELDSVGFSKLLARAQNASRDLCFAIGGDEGLDEAVTQRAEVVLSLSRMTLPHRLARLVLMEQLYRGFTLLRGEPYHRA